MNINIELGGTYTIKKGVVSQSGEYLEPVAMPEFSNIILDAGLARMGRYSEYMTHLYLGTGTSEPNPSNTSLDSLSYRGDTLIPSEHTLAAKSPPESDVPYTQVSRTFRVQPRGVSHIYSEIGVGHYHESNLGVITDVLLSRTLIRGLDGNPAVISVLENEYLDVTYELRMYMPTQDLVINMVPEGKDIEPRVLTMRAAYTNTQTKMMDGWGLVDTWKDGNILPIAMGNVSLGSHAVFDGPIRSITSGPSGNKLGITFDAFTHEFVDDTTALVTLKVGTADCVGTWRSLLLSTTGTSFQCQFDPPFDKTNEDSVELTYSISWGRR